MNTVLHKAGSRGYADHGWLKSYHTFSFAGYRDASRTNFGMLRVLNDDWIEGGTGFGMHPHENMEIVSIPLSGALEHRDTSGGHKIIKAGEVQIMSAGTGLYHSEKNASSTEAAKFLQIWVFPKLQNIAPRYDQKEFEEKDRVNNWQLLVSPDKEAGSLEINQDAWFSRINLSEGKSVEYKTHRPGFGVYFMILEGEANIEGQTLARRDALGLWKDVISVSTLSTAEILAIEVPPLA